MTGVRAHEWAIDEREYLRHESRRGRRHASRSLDPARTALIVVDLVPFFVAENPYARGIVPQVNRLAHAVRSAGGVVAWVAPADAAATPARVEFFGEQVAESYRTCGGAGRSPTGCGPVWRGATPTCSRRSRPPALLPGPLVVPALLEERGVDTVLVTGAVTNVCVESTARDAATLGLRVIVAADATAAGTDAEHNASLQTIYRGFGDVRATDEIVGLLA